MRKASAVAERVAIRSGEFVLLPMESRMLALHLPCWLHLLAPISQLPYQKTQNSSQLPAIQNLKLRTCYLRGMGKFRLFQSKSRVAVDGLFPNPVSMPALIPLASSSVGL
jgi:hypothetical protein